MDNGPASTNAGRCQPCRKRRRKCDEAKPRCDQCEQVGEICTYTFLSVHFEDSAEWTAPRPRGPRPVTVTTEDVLLKPVGELPLFVFDHWILPLDRDTREHPAPLLPPPRDVVDEIQMQMDQHARRRGAHGEAGQTMIPRYLPYWSTLTTHDRFYLHHFISCVMGCVSPYFTVPTALASGDEVVISAAMALGAADLATRYGRFVFLPGQANYSVWEPHRSHKIAGLEYTGTSLSKALTRSAYSAAATVTTHLLLVFSEIALGTCDGLHRYMNSIEQLMADAREEMSSCAGYTKLVKGLASIRATMDYLAGPSANALAERDSHEEETEDPSRPPWLVLHDLSMQALTATRNAVLHSAMRDNLARPDTLLQALIERYGRMLPSDDSPNRTDPHSLNDINGAFDDAIDKMRELERSVDDFPPPEALVSAGLVLDDSHELIEWEIPQVDFDPIAQSITVTPITLETYDDAMDVAHYAFCRIVCSVSLLQAFISHTNNPTSTRDDDPMNPWLRVLLGVARGLSMKPRTPNELYRRGVSSLIFQAAMRYQSIPAYVYLRQHIERLMSAGVGWDGMTFPVQLAKYMIGFMSRQTQLGRKILIMDEVTSALDETKPILRGFEDGAIIAYGIDEYGASLTIETILFEE